MSALQYGRQLFVQGASWISEMSLTSDGFSDQSRSTKCGLGARVATRRSKVRLNIYPTSHEFSQPPKEAGANGVSVIWPYRLADPTSESRKK